MATDDQNKISGSTRLDLIYGIIAVVVTFALVVFFAGLEQGNPLKPIGTTGSVLLIGSIVSLIINYIRLLHLTAIERKTNLTGEELSGLKRNDSKPAD